MSLIQIYKSGSKDNSSQSFSRLVK